MSTVLDITASNITWHEIKTTARIWQYDRYIAATLAPRKKLNDLLLIVAFAAEIDRIILKIREPTISAIRLQWWRDALVKPKNELTGNPLTDLLRNLIYRLDLPSSYFINYIEAQEVELYPSLLPDLNALNNYFRKRDGTLFELGVHVLGVKFDRDILAVITAGAQAYGLARTLAEIPLRLHSRQLLLPSDILKKYNICPRNEVNMQELSLLKCELAEIVRDNLSDYRRLIPKISSKARAIMLPVALTSAYIAIANKTSNSQKEKKTEPSQVSRAWVMLKSNWLGYI
ncbi:MAG: hypothetical protein TECD_00935 [Hyphomicrobiaceae bacterium hypho_1]